MRLTIILTLLLHIFSPTLSFAQKDIIISEELIQVNFNSNLNLNEMMAIKTIMAQRDIELQYKQIFLDDNEIVIGLSFNVDYRDGSKGSASQPEFDSGSFGFYKNYQKGAKVESAVGTLEKYKNE